MKQSKLKFLKTLNIPNLGKDIDKIDPANIFYIGRGEYWIRNFGLVRPAAENK